MTPEHGHILIAIGAALFASLLVAWLWGRRKREVAEPEREASPREVQLWNEHGIFLGSDGKWWMIAGPGARPLPDNSLARCDKPAPYSPIQGKGEAPVNPLEERVAALEERFEGMCNWMCDAAPRLSDLELSRLEAGGEGDSGVRVFQGGAYFIIISDELQMWSRLAGRKHWQDYGFFGTYEQALSRWYTYAELHGPERDEIVRAFREWRESTL